MILRFTTACLLAMASFAAVTFADDAQPPRNVLLIVTDDCNCDMACYGHPLVKTPNIDALALKGTRFEKAYAQYPVCNPSRSSFMTGMYPDQTGVLSNAENFRDSVPDAVTLSQLFKNDGYFAARVGKIYHYNVPKQIGTDGMDDAASWDEVVNPRGIDREIQDEIHTLKKGQFGATLSWLNLPGDAAEHTDGIGATAAIKLLDDHNPEKTGKPFFLAVGFYRPHTPFVASSEFFEMYPLEKIHPKLELPHDRDDIPVAALGDRPRQRELNLEQRKEIIQAYFASISMMDAQVGRVIAELDRLNLTSNTTIVFMSDHGYHLGAHGLWQKSDLFEGSCRVPLIIADPAMPKGNTTQSLVGLIDLYPTVAELTGKTPPDNIKGKSLLPILEDPQATVNDAVLSVTVSRAGIMHPEIKGKKVKGYSVRTPRYRYTTWGDGEYGHELYDYDTDPDEITNLADFSQQKELVIEMQSLLKKKREVAGGN